MGNKRYEKGYRFELETKKDFEQKDYKVIRSAKSSSPVDLIALKNSSVIQIQCKNIKHKISKAEKQEITKWANATGFPVLIMYKTEEINNEYISPISKGARV